MSEIESIETKLPIGMQLELNQLERDRLVANAKRERSQYIAASFRKFAAALKAVVARTKDTSAQGATPRLQA